MTGARAPNGRREGVDTGDHARMPHVTASKRVSSVGWEGEEEDAPPDNVCVHPMRVVCACRRVPLPTRPVRRQRRRRRHNAIASAAADACGGQCRLHSVVCTVSAVCALLLCRRGAHSPPRCRCCMGRGAVCCLRGVPRARCETHSGARKGMLGCVSGAVRVCGALCVVLLSSCASRVAPAQQTRGAHAEGASTERTGQARTIGNGTED